MPALKGNPFNCNTKRWHHLTAGLVKMAAVFEPVKKKIRKIVFRGYKLFSTTHRCAFVNSILRVFVGILEYSCNIHIKTL